MDVSTAVAVEREQDTRVHLAALYHAFVHYGWSDLTYTHISARVQDAADRYLINPYGVLFDEVRASNLLLVDFEGRVRGGAHAYNAAGHAIHTAMLRARPDINYVIHSHTRAGAAVAAMRCGLLPISQAALVVSGTLAYHPYGVADDEAGEGERLVRDLGDCFAMILHNHGLLVCGRTAAEAFLYHYFLQSACEIQVDAMRATTDLLTLPDEEARKLSAWGRPRTKPWGDKQWAAVLRLLDRRDPSFRE